MTSAEIKEILLEKDAKFKKLYEKHQGYERRLDQLNKRPFLSAAEDREKMEIKKQKLFLKDQMQFHIEKYRKDNS
ncbi:MAG TPA: YdcH family protein [Acidobacteriota bacterium]|nr:YdcH family protein [Acidobacteriota bacterium]